MAENLKNVKRGSVNIYSISMMKEYFREEFYKKRRPGMIEKWKESLL